MKMFQFDREQWLMNTHKSFSSAYKHALCFVLIWVIAANAFSHSMLTTGPPVGCNDDKLFLLLQLFAKHVHLHLKWVSHPIFVWNSQTWKIVLQLLIQICEMLNGFVM